MEDYYEKKFRGSGSTLRICWWAFIGIVALLFFSAFFTGCKTKKSVEKIETRDSIRVEYRESLVKVPVTVYVEVPVEEKEKLTNDTASHLTTSFAVSDAAMVWIDGVPFLRHTLANIPQKIGKTDSVSVKQKEYYKILYRTRYKTKNVYKDLSEFDKLLLKLGWVMLVLIGIGIVYGLYKLERKFR